MCAQNKKVTVHTKCVHEKKYLPQYTILVLYNKK